MAEPPRVAQAGLLDRRAARGWTTVAAVTVVRRRVEYLDYPLRRFRVDVASEHVARIFRQLVNETAALAERPRWYHTLTTNCTSSLIDYVNRVQPDAIPWHVSFVLTGRTDDYLAHRGYLDPGSAEAITRSRLGIAPLR